MPTTADDMWPPFIACHKGAFDARQNAKGTHALVIGVSAYPVLRDGNSVWRELQELSSAARSALEFAHWLLKKYQSGNDAPLRTLRLLLSPRDDKEIDGQGQAGVLRAARNNVSAALEGWAEDCTGPHGNTAILYVAGHGVYNPKTGQKLLLEDLSAKPNTDASIDLSEVKMGLENLHLEASYVFVDSCAAVLSSDYNYGGSGVSFSYRQIKDRPSSKFAFASARLNANAYGAKNGLSVFLGDLLSALDGKGTVAADADGRWVVRSYALSRALATSVHPKQRPWPGVEGADHVFHVADKPVGRVRVSLVPSEDAAKFDVSIENHVGQPDFAEALNPHPYEKPLDPGVHIVKLLGAKDRVWEPPLRAGVIEPYETFQAEFKAYPR